MLCKKCLIGSHNMMTYTQCSFNSRFGRAFITTDQLNENINISAFGKLDWIVKPFNAIKIDTAITSAVACAHRSNSNLLAALTSEHFGLVT